MKKPSKKRKPRGLFVSVTPDNDDRECLMMTFEKFWLSKAEKHPDFNALVERAARGVPSDVLVFFRKHPERNIDAVVYRKGKRSK